MHKYLPAIGFSKLNNDTLNDLLQEIKLRPDYQESAIDFEGNQFVEYCKKQAKVVTADDFMSGKAPAPKSPEEMSILVASMVNKASVLKGVGNTVKTDDQRYLIERIVRALFRLPQAEYTIIGLKGLLDINREAVKSVFLQMDEKSIQKFIEKNGYALGLEEKSKTGIFRK
jgi:hypothetical protein